MARFPLDDRLDRRLPHHYHYGTEAEAELSSIKGRILGSNGRNGSVDVDSRDDKVIDRSSLCLHSVRCYCNIMVILFRNLLHLL